MESKPTSTCGGLAAAANGMPPFGIGHAVAVVNGDAANVAAQPTSLDCKAAAGREVDVLGWPVERLVPDHEEHGSLEYEAAAVG